VISSEIAVMRPDGSDLRILTDNPWEDSTPRWAIITGFVVDRTGQYYWAFIIAAAVATAGITGWGLMIGNIAPLNWGAETHGRDAMAADTA
jgi:hypothetical protein